MRYAAAAFGMVTMLLLGLAIGKISAGPAGVATSDWMAFAGTMAGAMVTVAGAFIAVELQIAAPTRRGKRLLLDQIHRMRRTIELLKEGDGSTAANLEPTMKRTRLGFLKMELEGLRESRKWCTPDSASAVNALSWIERLDLEEQWLLGRIEKMEEDPFGPGVEQATMEIAAHMTTLDLSLSTIAGLLRK
ncbi:MAG TPA: hypothetical protein VIL42_10570 [Sphingomicrobium sp.]|jgi:hypothetical protein